MTELRGYYGATSASLAFMRNDAGMPGYRFGVAPKGEMVVEIPRSMLILHHVTHRMAWANGAAIPESMPSAARRPGRA